MCKKCTIHSFQSFPLKTPRFCGIHTNVAAVYYVACESKYDILILSFFTLYSDDIINYTMTQNFSKLRTERKIQTFDEFLVKKLTKINNSESFLVKRFNAKAATPRSLWCLFNWRNKAIHVVPAINSKNIKMEQLCQTSWLRNLSKCQSDQVIYDNIP